MLEIVLQARCFQKGVRMKNWIILAAVAVVGYGVYKYFSGQTSVDNKLPFTPGGAYQGTTYGPQLNPSGVPSFDETPISGDPQDNFAHLQTNALATTSGSNDYEPAFGPKQNQPTFGETLVW